MEEKPSRRKKIQEKVNPYPIKTKNMKLERVNLQLQRMNIMTQIGETGHTKKMRQEEKDLS